MIHIHWILDLHQKGEKITLRKPVLERTLVKSFQLKDLSLARIFQARVLERVAIAFSLKNPSQAQIFQLKAFYQGSFKHWLSKSDFLTFLM